MTNTQRPNRRARAEELTMLLSRLAESVYWTGRYLERAEGTGRLIRVHTELFLDLPRAAGVGWTSLLAVTGTDELFAGSQEPETEEAVIGFLAADLHNAGSILASLERVRENLRAARPLFPASAWEAFGRLWLWASATAHQAVERRTRIDWMSRLVAECQLLTGLLAGVMSHDEAYSFLEMGRFLERADMTTRVLDVQAGMLMGVNSDDSPYADITWSSVLRSLGAFHTYRRKVGGGVSGRDALRFLLEDPQFPRSVEHCLTEISRALLELPRYDAPMTASAAITRLLQGADLNELASPAALHEYVDLLQEGIGELHGELAATYFRPVLPRPAALAVGA